MVVAKECQYSYILVCKYKYYKPSYVCAVELSKRFYYTTFPNYVDFINKRVLLCKRYGCADYDNMCPDDFECPLHEFKCKYLIHNKLCSKIPKHFCMPLPKPKPLPSPDLTYYLNFHRRSDRWLRKKD